jgi:hypothetical protein
VTPLRRHRHANRIWARARAVGAADAAGECTGHMLRCLYAAQDRATQAGYGVGAMADDTLDGLDEGRLLNRSPLDPN